MDYGLIGGRLGHSYSVKIHRAFGDYAYELKELAPESLCDFMKRADFKGINVTIPYKQAVVPYLDGVSREAEKIGAVNTVINRGGRLYGYNTDYFGFKTLAESVGLSLKNKNVLILGSGGTSKTVSAVVTDAGAKSVNFVSRGGEINYGNVYSLVGTEIIVNTTPCGMFPNENGLPVTLGKFPNLKGVIDVIYNPLKTRLVIEAEKLGIPAAGGLMMLVAQGAAASELFTGVEVKDINAAYRKVKAEVTDIVLIGMPGCGKSVIGARLAELTGRRLIDTDAEVEKKTGKTIPEIFAERGEEYFREIESEVINEVSVGGNIVATGGGAVKRGKNVDALKRNGRLYFIKRPLSMLAKKGRPLSANGVDVLYKERKPLYEAAADFTVDNGGALTAAVNAIKEDFFK